MADTYLFSKNIGVYVNTAATGQPVVWKLAVCTSSKSLSISVASTEINNDCTGAFVQNLPSTASWTMSFEGDVNMTPSATEVSAGHLFDLAVSRAVTKFKFQSLDDSYIRYGEGFISQFDETATAPEYQTFSVSITGTGAIADVVPA
jgi:hypothetical protein